MTVSVGWNGQRSDSDCTRSTAWAEPGFYHVVAASFGADPVDVQFELKSPVPRHHHRHPHAVALESPAEKTAEGAAER